MKYHEQMKLVIDKIKKDTSDPPLFILKKQEKQCIVKEDSIKEKTVEEVNEENELPTQRREKELNNTINCLNEIRIIDINEKQLNNFVKRMFKEMNNGQRVHLRKGLTLIDGVNEVACDNHFICWKYFLNYYLKNTNVTLCPTTIKNETTYRAFCKKESPCNIIIIPQFIPSNTGIGIGHWILNVVEIVNKNVYIFNSLKCWKPSYYFGKKLYPTYEVVELSTYQQPTGTTDCGFICMYYIYIVLTKTTDKLLIDEIVQLDENEYNEIKKFVLKLYETMKLR